MANKVSNEKILKVITDFKTTGFQDALNALKSIEGEVNNLSNTFKQFSTDSNSVFKQLTQSLTNFTNPVKEQFSSLNDVVRKTMDEVKSKFDAFNKKSGMGKLREAIQAMDVRGVGNSSLSKELSDLDKEVRVLYKDIESKLSVAVTRLSKKVADGKLSVEQKNKVMERYAYLLSRNVNPSLEGFGTRLTEIKQKILAATEPAKKAGGIFEGLGDRMKVFLQYRAINFMVSSLRDLFGAAVELESSFANIQAITSASDLEMTKLKDTILRVGEASKYSVQEIANATTMLGQAGLSADEINNVLETTTQLAAGTGSELSNTVDLMTSALAVWGLNSEEASHLSDVMVTGMNRTKATLDTFRMAVQYAGATMASLNVSFDEFASVAAAASNAGLRASVVGTGLRAVTSELISPTKKMVVGLAQLGLSTEDVNVESQGLVNVLKKLKDAGLDASNAYSLFGRRAAQFILAAQGQLDVVDELQLAFVESGATLNAYNKQMNTVAAEWTALANTIKEAAYRVLQSTDGFIHDMIVKLKNGIRSIFFDEVDEINEEIGNIDDKITSLNRYYSLAEQYSKSDYKGDSEKQINQFNNLVKSLNNIYGLNIDIADSVDNITERYSDLIKKIEELKKASYDERKVLIEDEKENIKNTYFDNSLDKINRPEINIPTGSGEAKDLLFGLVKHRPLMKQDFEKSLMPEELEELKNDYNKDFDNFVSQLLSSGKDMEIAYQNKLKQINDDYEKQVLNLKDRAMNASSDELVELQETADYEAVVHSYLVSALDAAKEYLQRKSESRDYEQDKVFREKEDKITQSYKEINDKIAKSFEVTNKNINKFKDNASQIIKTTNDDIESEITNLGNFVNNLSEDEKTSLGDENVKKLKTQVGELKGKLERKLVEVVKEKIDKFIKWFELLDGKSEEINKLKNLKADTITSVLDQEIERAGANKPSPKHAGDPVRDAAKKFNERYAQAESQSQSLAYDVRKDQMERQGYQTRLSKLDTTGTLSKAYSRTSGKLADLEALKTAKQNAELLKTYKKDYGSLLEDVESNKVTLAEADKQSDGLISKMRELELSTTEATARFGDLDKVDLSDVDSKIEGLNDKLTKINESVDDPLEAGFQGFKVTIEEMADAYSAAGIGSMIAQDLGNGVSDALYSLSQGTKSMKDAFSDMARSILQDISKMLIRMAVLKAMEAGLAFFSGGRNVQAPTQGQLMMGAEYASGGFIPKIRAALGTPVRGGTPGKDSVPAMLMPGEYVLKKSAVDALGTNFLNDLNNNAAQTLTNTAANMMQNTYESSSESEPAVVNVWVVSKEEEAKMGPNDVIATISKDIMTGGQTRRLIQSVVAGRK